TVTIVLLTGLATIRMPSYSNTSQLSVLDAMCVAFAIKPFTHSDTFSEAMPNRVFARSIACVVGTYCGFAPAFANACLIERFLLRMIRDSLPDRPRNKALRRTPFALIFRLPSLIR